MTYHFFYGGILSQWYPCDFHADGSILFNCAEQYMMAAKARLFGDTETYYKIMLSRDPAEQKLLGRCVRGFDSAKWNSVARDIVYTGNLAKFAQNLAMHKYLMDTAPAEIVEASPTDRLWGIGWPESDPRAQMKHRWRGTNWLGEVLMAVRDGKPPEWSKTGFTYDKPPPI